MNRALVLQLHHLPGHVLAAAYRPTSEVDLSAVRQDFISWVASQRTPFDNWQQAWNSWAQATPQHPGRIRLHVLCPTCRGRMFTLRTGTPRPCTTCMARKRVRITLTALYQPSGETGTAAKHSARA